MLRLEQIETDGGTQTRASLQPDAVNDYAEAIQAGDKLPPVTVYYDGTTYWLADGFHRYAAHKKLEAREIEADVKQGEKRDAVLHSVGANATHGLRRTNEDKRRAVTVLLEDNEWREWSDREIGRRAGVSNRFVSNMRSETTVNGSQSSVRKGADGRTINTANIGKPKTDLSDYTKPRFTKTYNPPLSPEPNEIEELESVGEIPHLNKLELTEAELWNTLAPEIQEAASKPVPDETDYSRTQAHMQTEGYQRAEFLRKHIVPLAKLPEGQLSKDLQLPDSVATGLPNLMFLILKEVSQNDRTITANLN